MAGHEASMGYVTKYVFLLYFSQHYVYIYVFLPSHQDTLCLGRDLQLRTETSHPDPCANTLVHTKLLYAFLTPFDNASQKSHGETPSPAALALTKHLC